MLKYIIDYPCIENDIFYSNLFLGSSHWILLYREMRKIATEYGYPISCYCMIDIMKNKNPFGCKNLWFYEYHICGFVEAIGFGKMNDRDEWDGKECYTDGMLVLDFADVTLKFSMLQRLEAQQFLLHAIKIAPL